MTASYGRRAGRAGTLQAVVTIVASWTQDATAELRRGAGRDGRFEGGRDRCRVLVGWGSVCPPRALDVTQDATDSSRRRVGRDGRFEGFKSGGAPRPRPELCARDVGEGQHEDMMCVLETLVQDNTKT